MDYKEEAKNWMKIGKRIFYIHNVDECRYILLHCNILYSQLSFTANMKKNPDPHRKFVLYKKI
jgi:hypothetical protein